MRTLAMQESNSIALLEVAQLRFDAQDMRNASIYYERYRNVVRQQSARGLWFGVRLARAQGDKDSESSYALALRNRYPQSAEYEAYLRSLDSAGVTQESARGQEQKECRTLPSNVARAARFMSAA
jgi:type IV pilus assembly protein PilF